MTTGSAYHLPWTLVASIPSASSEGYSMSRRTLWRALAVVVALAAISPLLFEADLSSSAAGNSRTMQAQLTGLPPMPQAGRTAAFGVATPAPVGFRHLLNAAVRPQQ